MVEANYYVQEDIQMDDGNHENSEDDLIPKPPPRLAPRGIGRLRFAANLMKPAYQARVLLLKVLCWHPAIA